MGGKRNNERPRCQGCGLHLELCMCEGRPVATLLTKVVVVQHNRERHKPTNSARLLPHLLSNSELHYYAVRDEEFDTSPFADQDTAFFLLFPAAQAQLLTVELIAAQPQRNRALVVLDGTWSQCSRMSHRVPGLEKMIPVVLPEGGPSTWGVRVETHEDRLCTFEATMRALAIFEGADALEPLEKHFGEISRRMLYMKGKLPPPWKRGPTEPDHADSSGTT